MRISDEELDKLKQSEAENDWITAALVDDLQSAREKLEAARTVLEFYANSDNYRFGPSGSYGDRDTVMELDRGFAARSAAAALAEGTAK